MTDCRSEGLLTRRPHVYERSTTRAARAALHVLPDLLQQAEAAGAVAAMASEIGTACAMLPSELRTQPTISESTRLISSSQDKTDGKPRRIYAIASEGRRKIGAGVKA